ncbi:hypothetical protein D3C75_647980 [compost metagenome]
MCQSKSCNDIADCIDVRHVGAALVVDFDQTALVQLNADQVKTQLAVCIRTTAYSHKQVVRCNFFGFAAYRVLNGYFLVVLNSTFRFGIRYDLDAGLRHVLGNQTGHIFIEAWQYSIQTFDDRYFSAEFGVHLTKLSADIAAADYDHALRNLWQIQSFCRGQDTSAEREWLQLNRTGACSDDAVIEFVARGFMVIEQTGFVCADEHCFAAEYFNLVALHQAGYTGGHSLNYTVFELLGFSPVYLYVLGSHTENITVLCSLIAVSCRDQRFGRDTSAVQADTAELRFIYNEDFLAELGGTNCRHIPAGTCTNYQCVDFD